MNNIKTIQELWSWLQGQWITDYSKYESDLNRQMLKMLKAGEIEEDVFIEYLQITQGDVMECMEESLNENQEEG